MVQKMISNLVKNAPRIPIWILTSIKDPSSKLKRKTKNVEELKRGVDTLRFGGGRDPQEAILKGGRSRELYYYFSLQFQSINFRKFRENS